MSDYLDNLVRKGLNQAEVVQPRLASLFEPSPEARGLMAGLSATDLETAQDEPFSDETLIETRLMSQAPLKGSSEAHPRVINLNQPPLSATVPQQSVAPAPVPVATEHEPVAARLINSSEQEKQHALERSIRGIENEQAALREALQSQRAGETEQAPTPGTRSLTPAITVIRERATSQIEPAAPAPTEQVAAHAAAPTIKITIGRVDVRAVMPAAPATRPAPARPGPSLSLEDYLQQREGGKR